MGIEWEAYRAEQDALKKVKEGTKIQRVVVTKLAACIEEDSPDRINSPNVINALNLIKSQTFNMSPGMSNFQVIEDRDRLERDFVEKEHLRKREELVASALEKIEEKQKRAELKKKTEEERQAALVKLPGKVGNKPKK